jgi:D-glycero-D-manno-heptose 1,7-bisphosphate phosphatase
MNAHPAIFLDRDGVIIENRANYVRCWADVEIYPQALQALAAMRTTPYKIILVTNQSVVGRGHITLAEAQAINDRLWHEIERENGRLDAVYMCPHAPEDNCTCRKPRPGLLLQAAADLHLDFSQSIMIGDALTDLQAGQAAGCAQTILLRTGRGQAQALLPGLQTIPNHQVCDTLADALEGIRKGNGR